MTHLPDICVLFAYHVQPVANQLYPYFLFRPMKRIVTKYNTTHRNQVDTARRETICSLFQIAMF
jgi:hypothetical protein